jgi:hypothetical protein
MNRLLLPAAALLVLASCGSPRRERQPVEEFVQVRTRGDLDSFAGTHVAVEGMFGHVGARHGTVTLDSGLVIYVPHFDHFKRGDDWLKYVGRPVRVEGVLHTETSGTPGVNGPVIDIKRFETLDSE